MTFPKLKTLDAAALTALILAAVDADDDRMARAIPFATRLHEGQVRKDPVNGRVDTPYIEHCLRNVARLIRFGVRDMDILVATILHDTVEDCARIFAPGGEVEARESLLAHIRREFGEQVTTLVASVTNPHQTRRERNRQTDEQKFRAYQAQVTAEIAQSVGTFFVKLSDYIDNAGSLHWTPAMQFTKAKRLAKKYLPLVAVFRTQARMHDLAPADADAIDETLHAIGERLAKIVQLDIADPSTDHHVSHYMV